MIYFAQIQDIEGSSFAHQNPSCMPIFPLTPQQFSNLKKELKANKKKILRTLEEIIANPANPQQLNVIQLALFCLDLNSDLNLAQKLSNSFISAGLHSHAFSILLVQHSILHSKDQKILSPKTPSKTEIIKLLRVDTKTFTRSPSYICIFLINVMRVLSGLAMDISMKDLFSKKDGLIYWLDRLEEKDSALIRDHAFRIYYNLLNNYFQRVKDKPSDDVSIYVQTVLTMYKSSSKFQQDNWDKLAGNFAKQMNNLDLSVQREFFKYLISNEMRSKSCTCKFWLESILNLQEEMDEGLLALIAEFLGDSKILSMLFEFSQRQTVAWKQHIPKKITSKFEVALMGLFFPKVVKLILEKTDRIFQAKAQEWGLKVDTVELEASLECIGIMLYYTSSLDKDELKYYNSLHLAKAQLLFLLESDTSLILSCLDGLDSFVDLRKAGLTYNLGASLANRALNHEAVQFFERCRRCYSASIADSSLLVRKLFKPVQGECQCLLIIGRYADCVEVINRVLKKLPVENWLQVDHLKQLQCLVSLSVLAKSKSGTHKFDSICNAFNDWNLDLFDIEMKYVSQQGTSDHQFQLLKEASCREVPPLKKAAFLLKIAELDRPRGESFCQQAMGLIVKLDQTDPLVQSQKAMVLCESAISKGPAKSADMLAGLQIWQNLFDFIQPYRTGLKSPELNFNLDSVYLYNYLKQLAEYLMSIADFQLCTFAYGLASKVCSLCPGLDQAKESLDIYTALASAYIELGYSGRAGLSLGIAKSFLSSLDSKSSSRFYIAYSEYLLSIGNYQKSAEVRSKVPESHNVDNLTQLLDSKLSLISGDLKLSSTMAHSVYRNAMQDLKSNKYAHYETAVIGRAVKSLFLLINLLDFQGFPKKIDYYVNQGLQLAEKLNSSVWHGLFSIEKARLHCKRAELNESRGVISTALRDFENIDNLILFSSKLHLAHGDIMLKDTNSEDIARREYNSAETLIDNGLDPAFFESFDLGKIEQSLISFAENGAGGKENVGRCEGLESAKGTVLCSSSALNFKIGNLKEAEKKLTIAAKLPLTYKEKCLYYLNLSILRYDQLMRSCSSVERSEVFTDAVLGYPFHVGPLVKKKFCTVAQLNNVNKLQSFLDETFSILVEHGNPADAQRLSHLIVSVNMFKTFIMQVPSNDPASSCIFHLECPKSIYYRRKKNWTSTQKEDLSQWTSRMNCKIWDKLPKDTIVCCINCDPLSDTLFITTYEDGKSVHFKLPTCRLAQREAEMNGKGMSVMDAMREFDTIMSINKETTSNAKFCIEAEDRRKWKQTREELDNRLEKFLDRVESEWLAGFKGLLSSREISDIAPDSLLKFKGRLEKLLLNYISRCISKKTKLTVDEHLCKIIIRLGIDPEFEALEDILYYLLDSFQLRGIAIEYDEINIEDMRDDLKDAITLFYKESRMKTQKASYKHMVIIPDKHIQHFPWESIPILRGCSVSRMPSLEMLSKYLELEQTVDRNSLFYLLNPSGDLTRTENNFKGILKGSNGIFGRSPTKAEFLDALAQNQIFLYFGHGGGENYIDIFSIEKLSSVPILLLFGCSSGKLKPCGEFDPHGISLEYLSAGSLGVLGNLWDVTDIDIDRFSDDLMTRWGLFSATKTNRSSLPESCALARDACNLKFIVGAAPRPDQRQEGNDWRQRPGGARERGYRREDRGYPRQDYNQFPPRREFGREGPPRDYYQRNPMQINHRPFQPRPPPREYHTNYPPRDFRYPEGPREFRDFYRPTGPRPRPPTRRYEEPQFPPHAPSHTPSLMSSMSAQRRRSPPRFSPPPRSLMPKKEGNLKASLLPPKKEEMLQEDEDLDKEDDKSDSDASSYDQDEVEILIEKVDNDIAKQERILATARAKIAADERNALEEVEGIDSKKKQLLPDFFMNEYRQRQLEHNNEPCISEEQLISDVYASNRKLSAIFTKKLKERDLLIRNFGRDDLFELTNTQELDPIPERRYQNSVFRAPSCHPVLRSKLVAHIRGNLMEMEEDRNALVDEYLQTQETWQSMVTNLEKKMVKKEKKPSSDNEPTYGHGDGGLINIQTSDSPTLAPLDDPVSNAARSSRRAGFRSDVIRSEADWVKALSFLGVTGTDGNPNTVHNPFENLSNDKVAKEVPMISNFDVARRTVFKDYNSLVLDPEKDLQDYNNILDMKWSDYDRSVFKAKLLEEGKDFYKISSYLDQKSTHDCIMYYYREKINLRFKNLLRRNQSSRGRKKKDKGDGESVRPLFASFRLMEDEEVVYPSWHDTIADNSSSAEDDDDSNRVPRKSAFDTSAPVSPLGSPTFLDQQNADWDEEESKRALRGFELFGRDFAAVASMVGSKTQYQCKAFFNNHRRKVREEKEALNAELKKKKKGKPGRKKNEAAIQLQMDVDAPDQDIGEGSNLPPEKKRKQESDPGNSKKKKKTDISEENQNGEDNGARKTVSYWSVSERAEFLKALAIYGKNFEAIASNLGTKSGIQVRNYFHNSRRKLELDSILIKNGHSTDGQIHGPANVVASPKDFPRVQTEAATPIIGSIEERPRATSADIEHGLPPRGNFLASSHYSKIPYEQSVPSPIYTSPVQARSSSVDFGSYPTSAFEYGANLPQVQSPHRLTNRNFHSMRIDSLTTPNSAPAAIDSSYAPLSTEHLTLPAIREMDDNDAPVLAPIRSDSSNTTDTPKIPPIRLTVRSVSSIEASANIRQSHYSPAPRLPPAPSSFTPYEEAEGDKDTIVKVKHTSAASISQLLGPKSPVFNSSPKKSLTNAVPKGPTASEENNVVVVVSTKFSRERISKSPSPARVLKLSRERSISRESGTFTSELPHFSPPKFTMQTNLEQNQPEIEPIVPVDSREKTENPSPAKDPSNDDVSVKLEPQETPTGTDVAPKGKDEMDVDQQI